MPKIKKVEEVDSPKEKVEKKKAIKKVAVAKVEATVEKAPKKKTEKGTVTIDVFDIKGKVAETLALPAFIFGATVNAPLMTQAVRVYLANQRAGSAVTRTRGEVAGSTRKIYQQKGTGRARHGGITAPLFVHGGVALGPRPKDYSLKFSKKMRKNALFSALTARLQEGVVKVVTGLEKIEPKTKSMTAVIKQLGIDNKKTKLMLVIPFYPKDAAEKDVNWQIIDRAARNIKGVDVVLANQLNTYDVLNTKNLVFMKQAIASVEKHFA